MSAQRQPRTSTSRLQPTADSRWTTAVSSSLRAAAISSEAFSVFARLTFVNAFSDQLPSWRRHQRVGSIRPSLSPLWSSFSRACSSLWLGWLIDPERLAFAARVRNRDPALTRRSSQQPAPRRARGPLTRGVGGARPWAAAERGPSITPLRVHPARLAATHSRTLLGRSMPYARRVQRRRIVYRFQARRSLRTSLYQSLLKRKP